MNREHIKSVLMELIYEITHLSPVQEDGSHICRISKETLMDARHVLKLLNQDARRERKNALGAGNK